MTLEVNDMIIGILYWMAGRQKSVANPFAMTQWRGRVPRCLHLRGPTFQEQSCHGNWVVGNAILAAVSVMVDS